MHLDLNGASDASQTTVFLNSELCPQSRLTGRITLNIYIQLKDRD